MNKIIYKNDYFEVTENTKEYLSIKQCNGGVVIAPLFDGKFILIEHLRKNEYMIELPRGFLETNECHSDGAERELLEELGVRSKSNKIIGTLVTDSGLMSDDIKLVMCEVERSEKIKLQKSEGVHNYMLCTIGEIISLVADNKIKDNFTLASVALILSKKCFPQNENN